jgi:hypothetical protein
MPHRDKQAIILSRLFAVNARDFGDEGGSKRQGEDINLSPFISEGAVMELQQTRCSPNAESLLKTARTWVLSVRSPPRLATVTEIVTCLDIETPQNISSVITFYKLFILIRGVSNRALQLRKLIYIYSIVQGVEHVLRSHSLGLLP